MSDSSPSRQRIPFALFNAGRKVGRDIFVLAEDAGRKTGLTA